MLQSLQQPHLRDPAQNHDMQGWRSFNHNINAHLSTAQPSQQINRRFPRHAYHRRWTPTLEPMPSGPTPHGLAIGQIIPNLPHNEKALALLRKFYSKENSLKTPAGESAPRRNPSQGQKGDDSGGGCNMLANADDPPSPMLAHQNMSASASSERPCQKASDLELIHRTGEPLRTEGCTSITPGSSNSLPHFRSSGWQKQVTIFGLPPIWSKSKKFEVQLRE